MAIDPSRSGRMFLSTAYERSDDRDPKNPRKLYASLTGRGIYVWIRP